MKIENLRIKSIEKYLLETEDGETEKWSYKLENNDVKVKIIFNNKPEQVFIPNEEFNLILTNPQKKLINN